MCCSTGELPPAHCSSCIHSPVLLWPAFVSCAGCGAITHACKAQVTLLCAK